METTVAESLDGARLRRLLDVGRSLVAELEVDTVLERVLEVACDLTGARYAAVGVLDAEGAAISSFLVRGVDETAKRTIGSLPRGHGVLGELIRDPKPLRLERVGDHPRSYGFPPGHPPMTTFLGVPIRIRDNVYGNLYLTDKREGSFDDADQDAIEVLADWAAIAIDNARVYAAERDRRAELETAVKNFEATVDITRALGDETDLDRVLELICKRSRALVEAKLVLILLADDAGDELHIVSMAGEGDRGMLGLKVPVEGSVTGGVYKSRRTTWLSESGTKLQRPLADRLNPESGLLIALTYRDATLGVLVAIDNISGKEFPPEAEEILGSFATSAAIAVATAQRVAAQGLRRSIDASERERTRWARELHDETLQELAGIRLLLGGVRRRVDDESLDDAIEQADLTITGLRHLITELRPAALDEAGVEAALEALATRMTTTSGIEVVVSSNLAYEADQQPERMDREVESVMYRVAQEAVNNAVRHSDAARILIDVNEVTDGSVAVRVDDDGDGFDPSASSSGFGLAGMRERVELIGGKLSISTAIGEGTTITATLPVTRDLDPSGR